MNGNIGGRLDGDTRIRFARTTPNRQTTMHKRSADTRRIAFIRMGTALPANTRVLQLLQSIFPDCVIKIVDVSKLVRQRQKFVNLFFVFGYYGADILRGNRKFRSCKSRTPYMFKTMKKLVRNALAGDTYLFSFQIQSMFDGSTGKWPHFVYTDHTHLENLRYSGFNPQRLYAKAWISLETSIYQNATVVFTRSSNISRSLIEKYGVSSERTVCVYAGGIAVTSSLEIDGDKYSNKSILFVGLNWERKGGPELLAAFERVLEQHPDASLTIVGCSPTIALANCKVVGRVSTDEVQSYYEQASIFCMPTTLEPFGLVFVEAMFHGLPIVATNTGAVPDMVQDGTNGFLVEPGDIAALVHALVGLLGNPCRCKEFGGRSRQLARERYSWDKVGDRMKQTILSQLPPG